MRGSCLQIMGKFENPNQLGTEVRPVVTTVAAQPAKPSSQTVIEVWVAFCRASHRLLYRYILYIALYPQAAV